MRKLKIYINFLTFLLSLLIPKKKNRWVFGAWFGNRVSDNPYALYNYMKDAHPEIECIWVCNDLLAAKQKGFIGVRRNSIIAIWKCLTAKVSIMNQGYLDFGNYNWIHHSYKVQLWHGVPWKKIGEDTETSKKGVLHKISHKAYLFSSRCDLYIAPSEETRRILKTAFVTDDSHILSIGQPRNEILMDSFACEEAKKRLKKAYGEFDSIILYMPTFRDLSTDVFSFFDIIHEINPILHAHNAILLEKEHYVQKQRTKSTSLQKDRVFNVEGVDSQELLAAADVLITDYSSCFFDFLLKNKPIVHYIYDYDYYQNKDRGLYYDLNYVSCGPTVMNKQELLTCIEKILCGEDNESEKRKTIKDRFDTYEIPENSKIIYNEIKKHIS